MEAYLRTCSIAVRNNIWNICWLQRITIIVNDAETNLVCNDNVDDGFDPVTIDGESKFVPALWNSLLFMSAYLECGMHLVFHGILAYWC